MDFKANFESFLDLAERCGQSYVGHGNPNAKVLIVANEPGTTDKDLLENDLGNNLIKWRENLLFRPDQSDIKEMFNAQHDLLWDDLNPLWPFKGQHFSQIRVKMMHDKEPVVINKDKRPTSRSWLQYQKLIDMIYNEKNECHRQKEDPIDFFKHAFITDFSAAAGLHSNDVSEEKRMESIKKRLPMFGSDFISCFPVIIVASGHYVRDIPMLKDLFKVFPGFKEIKKINDNFGWRNIHYGENRSRILIHTKHFASAIKDEYLRQIASICSPYVLDDPSLAIHR